MTKFEYFVPQGNKMKVATQIATSMLALAGLLGMAASCHATDIAELPLKASVLAKPNVIFGLDDSGSMDSELMLNTNDGALWWDYNARAGWDGSGKPWFNSAGNANDQWRKMVYLFPNGRTSTTPSANGARIYTDDANAHFAVPATAQFAFLRSSSFNPLYYNPTVNYAPWAPAWVSGAAYVGTQATPSAAKSHPIIGTETFALSADRALTTAANRTFMALPGMTIPAGSQTCVHDGNGGCTGGWTVEAVARSVPAGTALRLAMAYYPATYYVKEDCTLSPDVCVTAPDGSKLRRQEIKPANYASAEAYDAEMKNFANWWQFYRKRKLMLSASMGKVLEPLTGLRMDVVKFNNRANVTMYDTDATLASMNGLQVAGTFYATNGDGGTPTRETLRYIGEQFRDTSGVIQYACQRNNAFIVTDGFANNGSVTPGDSGDTYSQSTWGGKVPYDTTYPGTLADNALFYYTTNLKPTMTAEQVPINKCPAPDADNNPNLHMNTYGLTLGARGTIFAGETTPQPTAASDWPNPTAARSPTAVDDLWHATINGRGRMYLATTPEETALSIQRGLTDMLSQQGAQGGIAVSTVNLASGDSKAYFGYYNPAGWSGDLKAFAIDPENGSVIVPPPDCTGTSTGIWSASEKLTARVWTTRIIATSNGSSGIAFTEANVGSTVNPSAKYGSNADVIDYLRGKRTGEGTAFRARTSLMGAVINSEPVVARDQSVVYVASGEGMLHAFDTSAGNPGNELWAFVPSQVLASMGETAERGYTFRTKYDGSPVLGKFSAAGKLLVSGMGAAGRSYFALDVSNPRGLNEAGLAAKLKWEFPGAADAAKVGQTLGRPVFAKTDDGKYVVLVTSGYNVAGGKGYLWMLDATDGTVLHEFEVPAGVGEAGLAHVAAFGEATGTVQYVYGGDLLGNVWRFDLKGKGVPLKLATLLGPTGQAQPVTAAPELLFHKGQRIIFVGTGRLMDISDFGNSNVQTIYAIADGTTLTNARSSTSMVRQTYVRHPTNPALDTLTSNGVDWTTQRGWYLDLPGGEQLNTRATIAYGGLAFVSNVNGGTDCSASSYLYLVDVLTGKKLADTNFFSTRISNKLNSSGVTALSTTGRPGQIVGTGQDADGVAWTRELIKGGTILPGKNSWIEIRRQ